MKPYQNRFLKGSRVRIVPRPALDQFRSTWKLHHPLIDEQLLFAGEPTTIAKVGFYHGGDVVYELHGVPGIWHEVCLEELSAGSV